MVSIYQVRRIVSLILLFAGLVSFITGFILFLKTARVIYRGIESLLTPRLLHTYSSFIASGAAIIHVYLNWNSIKRYLGIE